MKGEIFENTFIIAAAMQGIAGQTRACKHNQGKIWFRGFVLFF